MAAPTMPLVNRKGLTQPLGAEDLDLEAQRGPALRLGFELRAFLARDFQQPGVHLVGIDGMARAKIENDVAVFDQAVQQGPPLAGQRFQRLQRQQVGLHVPGIAPRRGIGRLGGIDEHGIHALLGQMQAQRCPHHARADDDDVGFQVGVQPAVCRRRVVERPHAAFDRHAPRFVRIGRCRPSANCFDVLLGHGLAVRSCT